MTQASGHFARRRWSFRSISALGRALILAAAYVSTAAAQTAVKQDGLTIEPSPAPASAVPPAEVQLMLVRSTLQALNHANSTGNYTVLRDLASPDFQSANNAAQLGRIFGKLRGQNLNLSPILVVMPEYSAPTTINAEGLLKISGYFPTRPLRINFQMLFQPVEGTWRLFGLAVDPAPAG